VQKNLVFGLSLWTFFKKITSERRRPDAYPRLPSDGWRTSMGSLGRTTRLHLHPTDVRHPDNPGLYTYSIVKAKYLYFLSAMFFSTFTMLQVPSSFTTFYNLLILNFWVWSFMLKYLALKSTDHVIILVQRSKWHWHYCLHQCFFSWLPKAGGTCLLPA
jgi:hypothetical protein